MKILDEAARKEDAERLAPILEIQRRLAPRRAEAVAGKAELEKVAKLAMPYLDELRQVRDFYVQRRNHLPITLHGLISDAEACLLGSNSYQAVIDSIDNLHRLDAWKLSQGAEKFVPNLPGNLAGHLKRNVIAGRDEMRTLIAALPNTTAGPTTAADGISPMWQDQDAGGSWPFAAL